MERRATGHLWRWAGTRLKLRDPGAFHPEPQQHRDTCEFVDAVHTASHVLQSLMPFVRGFANLRHTLRGTTMAPEVEDLNFLQNWNSAEDFLEGAEFAHRTILGAMWQPSSATISPNLRESLGPDALQWLTDARSGPHVRTMGDALVSARFESFGGPVSLEHIRRMDASSLRNFRDPERLSAFSQDTWNGTPLKIVVAAVSEARCERSSGAEGEWPDVRRRADKVSFSCEFNLREGIAGPMSVTSVEELLVEDRESFNDAE